MNYLNRGLEIDLFEKNLGFPWPKLSGLGISGLATLNRRLF